MSDAPKRAFQFPWRNREQISDDFNSEVTFHRDMRVAELVAEGKTEDQARVIVEQETGDIDDARRYVNRADRAAEAGRRRGAFVSGVVHDARRVLRRMWRAPAITATATFTLAFGIGACTLMSSIVTHTLIDPPPFEDPDRLAMIVGDLPQFGEGLRTQPLHGAYFSVLRRESRVFESLSAFRSRALNVRMNDGSERLDGIEATGDFFATVGTRPALGRFFTRAEETPGADKVVVLANAAWRRVFGGDSSIIGRTLTIDNEPFVVIGVAAPAFEFPRGADMPGTFQFAAHTDAWIPIAPPTRGPSDMALVARLNHDVPVERGRQDLDRVRGMQEELQPRSKGWLGTRLTPMQEQITGSLEPMLLTLTAAVLLVLLIACVNVAQLQLAQLQSRRRDAAVRAALGASGGRIAGELVVETLALSAGAGAIGAALSWAGIAYLRSHASTRLPQLASMSFDSRTVATVMGATLFAWLATSIVPSLAARKILLGETLRSGGRTGAGRGLSLKSRRALIIAEVTLSVVLVTSAGLLVRSLTRQLSSATGFDAPNGVTFEVTLPAIAYPEKQLATSKEHPKAREFFATVLQQLRTIRGVDAVAIGKPLPLSGAQEATSFYAEGAAIPADGASSPIAEFTIASAGMFSALGTPLLQGRDFTDADREDAPPVAIINHAMAKKFWPDADAVGKRLKVGGARSPAEWMTVIGVVSDIKRYTLTETARPEMIVPYTQNPYPSFLSMQFVVRSGVPLATLVPQLRAVVSAADPSVPISRVRTIDDLIGETSATARFSAQFMAGYAIAAVLLAMIGLYSVVAFSVHQRRQEFGIRRALGATPQGIVTLVVRDGLMLALIGVVAGTVLSLFSARLLQHYLYEIGVVDVPTIAGAALMMTVAAVAACYTPARNAGEVDPRVALDGG